MALIRIVEASELSANESLSLCARDYIAGTKLVAKTKRKVDVKSQNNTFEVDKGLFWTDLDPRNKRDGVPRVIKIITVGDWVAVVENTKTGKRSFIELSRFNPNIKRGLSLNKDGDGSG
jgi:hypothetical protein